MNTSSPPIRHGFPRRSGFISLWLVGLIGAALTVIVVFSIGMVEKVKAGQKYAVNSQLDAAYDAVVGFATSNRRLPNVSEFTALAKGATDVYGNNLVYLYDTNMASATPDICGYQRALLSVNNCAADTSCAAPVTTANVPFAILSSGVILANSANKISQTYTSGASAAIASAATLKTYNLKTSVGDYATPTVAPLQEYDDVVKFADLTRFRTDMGCRTNQMRITNNELPKGKTGLAYSATVFAEGGIPYTAGGNYKWCIQGTLPAGLTFTPSIVNGNCTTLVEESWSAQYSSLAIAGTPTVVATTPLTFFARDNNNPTATGINSDNITSRKLNLTVIAGSGGGGGTIDAGSITLGGKTTTYSDGTVITGSTNLTSGPGGAVGLGGNPISGGDSLTFKFPSPASYLGLVIRDFQSKDASRLVITFLNASGGQVGSSVTWSACSNAASDKGEQDFDPGGGLTFSQVRLTVNNGYFYLDGLSYCAATPCFPSGYSYSALPHC
jgi:hypothetical protein